MERVVIKVLIIDDDPEDAHLAAIALRNAGPQRYELKRVTSLDEAFKAIRTDAFDVALLDLGLQRSQGLETLRAFRKRNKTIPVVILSGLEDEAIAIQSLEGHAQDYLFKSDVDSSSLSRAIRYAIQRQASVMEVRSLLARVEENEEVLLRKNERLKRLYETVHTFVDNVSHEFRTPLTVVKEYVSLVRDGTMGEIDPEQERFLSIAEDRADDLNTMVDDMLDMSKMEAGLLGVCRKDHSIQKIVDRVVPSLSRKAEVKELTLRIQIDEDVRDVYCDGEKIERVLINLAVNAMKFTKPGGSVTIAAQKQDSDVLVSITDDGPGISKDNLKTIFARFEQVENEVRRSTKGFGLGLSIAKELVGLNLGQINVESEVGVGSTFSFTIPESDPRYVTQRYLAQMGRSRKGFLTMVVAQIDPLVSAELADEVDVFLGYLVRGNDLAFRTSQNVWILLLPEPESEAKQFTARATLELESTNRNRPRGPLPAVKFKIDDSWSDLRLTSEEILARVHSHISRNEMIYA